MFHLILVILFICNTIPLTVEPALQDISEIYVVSWLDEYLRSINYVQCILSALVYRSFSENFVPK